MFEVAPWRMFWSSSARTLWAADDREIIALPLSRFSRWDREMRDFIHRLNIERFQELLVLEVDLHRRRTLEELLAEEEKRFTEEVAKDNLDPEPGLPAKKRLNASCVLAELAQDCSEPGFLREKIRRVVREDC